MRTIAIVFLFVAGANGLRFNGDYGNSQCLKLFGTTRDKVSDPLAIEVKDMTYDQFVHTVVDALRERPLGQGSLQHFLSIADEKFANTGEWVEFGSFSGKTIREISNRRKELGSKRVVHGFDAFQGLPETWRSGVVGGAEFDKNYVSEGSFDRKGQPPFEDPESVQWHIGWYNETASAFAKDGESLKVGDITFAHMDADLYSATDQAFKALEHRLAPGAYIVFDELVGYPEYKEHEIKALYELLQRTKRTLNVIGYPGPLVLESPDDIAKGICEQGGEHGQYPQNALVQLL